MHVYKQTRACMCEHHVYKQTRACMCERGRWLPWSPFSTKRPLLEYSHQCLVCGMSCACVLWLRWCSGLAAKPFNVVQKEVADLVRGKVLVGHAIRNDLKVISASCSGTAAALHKTHASFHRVRSAESTQLYSSGLLKRAQLRCIAKDTQGETCTTTCSA